MEFVKYVAVDSCIEVNLLSGGAAIFKDTEHDSVVGLSKLLVDELVMHHSCSGWNVLYNKKHCIKIVVLDTLNIQWLKDVGFIERFNCALDFFPELHNRTVYIGLTNDSTSDFTYAYVDIKNFILFFNIGLLTRLVDTGVGLIGLNICIFHELMHIVVGIEKLPQTEQYCSIYAMARMPNEMVDEDEILYIAENGDRKVNADLCRKAVEFNESGKRGYIKYLKSLVDDINLSRV